MKSRSSNPWFKAAALCSLGLGLALVGSQAKADQWDKRTIFTINEPIQIRDTYLEPGTYVLKLADSNSDRHIVYIYNDRETHLINTIMAVPNYRIQPTGNSQFTFWETPQGSVRAMRAWFYPGDDYGQEFPYPSHLRQIASYTPPAAPVPAPPAAAPAPEAVNQEPPAPQTAPQQTAPQEPVEVAQNTPPPAPAAAPPAPAPAPAPQELPKTATSFPLIGLCGLLSLGLFGLVRLLRPALE